MPGQTFTHPTTGEVIATLSWDMGQRAVDVDAGGTLLTRVTDIETLKVAGMQGQTPRGDHLWIRPLTIAAGLQFDVECNGLLLAASHVNFGMQGPVLDAPAAALDGMKTAPRADGLSFDDRGRLMRNGKVLDDHLLGLMAAEQRVDTDALKSGRTWILWLAVLQTVQAIVVACIIVVGGVFPSREVGAEQDRWPLWLTLLGFGVVALMIVPIWSAFALTYRKANPATGFRIMLVMIWLAWLPLPPIGWFLLYFGHKAMARAIAAANVAQGNHERNSTLAEMNHPLAQQR